MQRPHLLVVAWCFPPFTGGGVYRPLNFVRHLKERGFRITVLTGRLGRHEPQDPSLLARIPEGIRVLRCPHVDPFRTYEALVTKVRGKEWTEAVLAAAASGARSNGPASPLKRFKSWISESVKLPDRYRSWVAPAVLRGALGVAGDEPDLLFSTSPPNSVHLVAQALRSMFHCPWIVDFRDPWVGNPFRNFDSSVLDAKDRALEDRVVHEASQVVLNTPSLERRFRERYPRLDHFRVITNGFDPEQFPMASSSASPSALPSSSEVLTIVHVGNLYGMRSGRFLLEGLCRLRVKSPRAYASVRVHLIGRIDDKKTFEAELAQRGLTDVFHLAGSVPHPEALRHQQEAGVLLILGVESGEPEVQVPSKLYEYFAARRPILTLSRKSGAIEEVLRTAAVPFELAEPDDPDGIADCIARLHERFRHEGLPMVDAAKAARFRYDRLTEELVRCIEDALAATVA